MRRTRLLLRIAVFLVAGVVVVLFLPRRSPPPAPFAPEPPARTTAATVEAPVLIAATAIRLAAAADGAATGEPLANWMDPDAAESGVLSQDAAAAAQEVIDRLTSAAAAEVLARPKIMVLSGQPARIVVGSVPVPGATPPTRQSIELDVRTTAFADGAADLRAAVLRKDVSGELSIFLDDLGVPMGERRAQGDLHLPRGSRAYLARRLKDGSLLLVLIDVDVQLPPPSDAAAGG